MGRLEARKCKQVGGPYGILFPPEAEVTHKISSWKSKFAVTHDFPLLSKTFLLSERKRYLRSHWEFLLKISLRLHFYSMTTPLFWYHYWKPRDHGS